MNLYQKQNNNVFALCDVENTFSSLYLKEYHHSKQ